MWWRTSNCSSLLIYRPREDERLSWLGWLTYSGLLNHISGHPSATGRAQYGERTLARDWRSTAEPRGVSVWRPVCDTWCGLNRWSKRWIWLGRRGTTWGLLVNAATIDVIISGIYISRQSAHWWVCCAHVHCARSHNSDTSNAASTLQWPGGLDLHIHSSNQPVHCVTLMSVKVP